MSGGLVSFEHSYYLVRREQVTKSEFVDQVADRAGLSKRDATGAVDAFLETIEDALRRGSEVSFSGFGKFSVSHRNAREGRNPATGERIQIAASNVPKFTAGAGLKKAVK
jgi:DNA-binding protein HU-beta